MTAHILIRETKPNRDPPRLAWIVAVAAMIGLIAVLFSADGYRHEIAQALHQLIAWLDPAKPDEPGQHPTGHNRGKQSDHVIRVEADSHGQYHVAGLIDGVEIQFLIDSGANTVVLNRAAARQLSLGRLNFDIASTTANGTVLNAKIKLKTLAVETFVVSDFPAYVDGGELDECLLGVSWINLFNPVEIKNGLMTLHY